MLRRLVATGVSVALLTGLTGCGAGSGGGPTPAPDESTSAAVPTRTLSQSEAATAFELLKELDYAREKRDCEEVLFLTTSAASELGGRACEATRNGRPVPARVSYEKVEYFLPDRPQERPWFVALARKPQPSYFLFAYEEDRWRLAYGPVRLVGKAPDLEADHATRAVPTDDPEDGLRARLVPQKHLAFLSDRFGLSGVRVASGDPLRALLTELVRKPAGVRPDRLSYDVQLVPGETTALGVGEGGALVFHAVKIVYTQRARSGRLAHPLFGADAVRAFTRSARPKTIHVSEIVQFATRVGADQKLTTIAMSRSLADITT
ncbi:hypothetical protein Sme01_24200 [Sphaerisporangium melleum]|uniref:DUF8094 domain-containing protein n=1 Tax=Sphaerisporangium melleum TaxID=321316 RepID=A0A917VD06_9ACTN|nr:hypothetical protein [Sphaerisporangium melleum]GGK65579.1 hypothetical protein GCM10007964_05730 [Sphaerisporangium melleum]GII69944.1 hypothetical protein Sme01_24200 [Sphaerisporangium melleum]